MLPALHVAVKLSVDKAGHFVVPRSREPWIQLHHEATKLGSLSSNHPFPSYSLHVLGGAFAARTEGIVVRQEVRFLAQLDVQRPYSLSTKGKPGPILCLKES